MSNIDKAFMNMPKLMGVQQNNFMGQPQQQQQPMMMMQTQPMMMMGTQQTMPNMMGQTMPNMMGQGGTMQPFQFQQMTQQQMYQQQMIQQQNNFNNTMAQNPYGTTLKLGQKAYQPGVPKSYDKFMKTDPRIEGKVLDDQDKEQQQQNSKTNALPSYLLKDTAKADTTKKSNFDRAREEAQQNPDAKKFILEDSFEETDYEDQLPLCQNEPQRLALEYQRQEDLKMQRIKEKEEQTRSENVYRAVGRKQKEINEQLFNADVLREQRQKTQDLMMNALQLEMDKLEKEADKYDGEIKDADDAMADLAKGVNDMDNILEKIKYQRQADRIMKKVDQAIELNEDDVDNDDVKGNELYRDMTTQEINYKLEGMYDKNQRLYGQISQLMAEIQEDQVYGNLEEADNYSGHYDNNNDYRNNPRYMEQFDDMDEQNEYIHDTFMNNEEQLDRIRQNKYVGKKKEEYYNRSGKQEKSRQKQQQQKVVQNKNNNKKQNKQFHVPQKKGPQVKPLYTTSYQ